MIKITINKKTHRLATEWTDITVKQGIAINALTLPVDNYKDDAEWVSKDTINYMIDVFCICSDIQRKDIQGVSAGDIKAYFLYYLLKFVIDLHSIEPISYVPNNIRSFKFGDKEYFMPESLKVESTVLPMYNTSAVDFVESSNIMSNIAKLEADGLKHMPYIVAIYCRPAGEEYNEQVTLERAKEFMNLPMSVVWEVFFCIQTYTQLYVLNTLNYTNEVMRRQLMLLKLRAWFKRVFRLGFTGWRSRKSPGTSTL